MNILRTVIDKFTAILAWIRKDKIIEINNYDSLVKINLGCGLTVAPDWLNIDGSLNAFVAHYPRFIKKSFFSFSGSSNYYSKNQYINILDNNRFVFHNLSYGLPIGDEKANFCYSSHLLEHLTKHQGEYLIKEIFRVLKPNGLVRIVVPDLEFAIGLYEKGQKKRMLSDFFFVDLDGSYLARHKYMYDFQLIKEALEQCGFINIIRYVYQQGYTPDIEILDNQQEVSLYVEAQKP